MRDTTRKAIDWWASKIARPVSSQQINLFKILLGEYIERELDSRGGCSLSTGSSPVGVLHDVIIKSGVSSKNFPQKTYMIISEGSFQVSCNS